jgi:hypothetical protein
MDRSSGKLESIVRNIVCELCAERTATGACHCAIFEFFPQVTEAIASVKSGDVNDYVAAIRREVCRVCPGEAPDGVCEARRQARCALDAYLLLVVEAVEEGMSKVFGRPGPRTRPEMRS